MVQLFVHDPSTICVLTAWVAAFPTLYLSVITYSEVYWQSGHIPLITSLISA